MREVSQLSTDGSLKLVALWNAYVRSVTVSGISSVMLTSFGEERLRIAVTPEFHPMRSTSVRLDTSCFPTPRSPSFRRHQ